MGEKSGEYGGSWQTMAPAASTMVFTEAMRWAPRLSQITIWPGRSFGTNTCCTNARKAGAVGAARKHQCSEHALGRHGTDDCDVLAVIDRRVRHHTLAGGSPTVRASHRHVEPRLVDHHDVFGVDQCLRDREARPLERDVGTVLFARMRRLFFLGRSIALSASQMVVSLTEMPVRAW